MPVEGLYGGSNARTTKEGIVTTLLYYVGLTLAPTAIVMLLVLAIAMRGGWAERKPRPRIKPINGKK